MNKDAPKKLTTLLTRLKKEFEVEEVAPAKPVTQLAIGFLQWEATAQMAEQAYSKLMDAMVDINELRISYDDELIGIIGKRYPDADVRIARMREALNDIFTREYGVAMHSIEEATKKQQRTYLDSLPGMVPYVAALVTLLSFGGHAVPVDNKLLELLIKQGVLDSDTDIESAESFLQHNIKANESVEAHLLFQAWSDKNNPPGTKKKSTKKKTTAKKTPKKTANKKSR